MCEIQAVTTGDHEPHEAFSHKEILQCIEAVKPVIGASRISVDRNGVWILFSFYRKNFMLHNHLSTLAIRQNEKW